MLLLVTLYIWPICKGNRTMNNKEVFNIYQLLFFGLSYCKELIILQLLDIL